MQTTRSMHPSMATFRDSFSQPLNHHLSQSLLARSFPTKLLAVAQTQTSGPTTP